MAEGRAFNWDDMISNESTFMLLDEGDYKFRVENYVRGRFSGSAKVSACTKVTLTLAILDDADSKLTSISHMFLCESSVEFRISEFFLSVGLKKHGESVPLSYFEKTPGLTGKCHIYKDKWTNDRGEEKENNKIKYFIDAAPATQPTQAQYTQPAQMPAVQAPYAPAAAPVQPPVQTAPQQTFGGWGNAQPGTGWTAR